MVPVGMTKPEPAAMKLTKTKMCKFDVRGLCSRGTHCQYAHSNEELKPSPDLRYTKLCSMLIQTGACNNPKCTFAHTRGELRTAPCRFFIETGACKFGSQCNFSHSRKEPASGGRALPKKSHEQPEKANPPMSVAPDYLSFAGAPRSSKKEIWAAEPSMDSPAYVSVPVASGPWGSLGATDNLVVPPPGLSAKDDGKPLPKQQAPPTERGAKHDIGSLLLERQALLRENRALQLEWQAVHKLLKSQDLYCAMKDLLVDQQGGTLLDLIPHMPGDARVIPGPLRSCRSSQSTLCSLSDLAT